MIRKALEYTLMGIMVVSFGYAVLTDSVVAFLVVVVLLPVWLLVVFINGRLDVKLSNKHVTLGRPPKKEQEPETNPITQLKQRVAEHQETEDMIAKLEDYGYYCEVIKRNVCFDIGQPFKHYRQVDLFEYFSVHYVFSVSHDGFVQVNVKDKNHETLDMYQFKLDPYEMLYKDVPLDDLKILNNLVRRS